MTDIRSEATLYSYEGLEMSGFAAWDADQTGPRPLVLVVHEWWGLNDYAKLRPIFKQAKRPAATLLYPPYGKIWNPIYRLMVR